MQTSRCYFFWPVLIFGKSTRKTVLFCVFFVYFLVLIFLGGKLVGANFYAFCNYATIILKIDWPAPRRPACEADISERRRTNAWKWETWSKVQNPASGNQRDQFWKKCNRLSHFGPGLTLDWWKATLRRAEQRIPRMALPTTCLDHLRPSTHQRRKNAQILQIYSWYLYQC